jgi:hypothetical protein
MFLVMYITSELVYAVTLLTCVLEELSSNLGWDTGYPATVAPVSPQLPLYTSFPICHPLIIRHLDVTSELLGSIIK